jgi:hypothetical protein
MNKDIHILLDDDLLKVDAKIMGYARYYFENAALVFLNRISKAYSGFKVNIHK